MATRISLIDLVDDAIERGNIVLPVFNSAAMRIQQELLSKEPETEKLVKIISGDQALSTRVLRMANSSFYKGLNEVLTVRAAVVRLGLQEVGRISLVAAAKNQFTSNDKVHRQIMRRLWQHSVGCAMGARWLAQRCKLAELESEAFFAGLFHDVGKLFVLMIIEQLKNKNPGLLAAGALLGEAMDSLHCEQGYRLMRKWSIPEKYCLVARHHDDDAFDGKNLLLVLVRTANMLCHRIGIGLRKEPDLAISSSEEAEILGLSEIDLAELEIRLEDTRVLTS